MLIKLKTIHDELEEHKILLNIVVELFGCDSDITLIFAQKVDILMNEFYGIA